MSLTRLSSVWCLSLVACRPEFDERDWLIDSVRVLAVKSEPPEAKSGEAVQFTAFLSAPEAVNDEPKLAWGFCSAPKAVTENNAVASACLNADALKPAGRGLTIDVSTPLGGCALFGPDTPPGNFRPRDADATGGYYQPLRVDLPGAVPAFHLQRIACGLAEASAEVATEFALAYAPNKNPSFAEFAAHLFGSEADLTRLPGGAVVDFEASWAAEAAENYAYYDRATQSVITRRESLRVAWYVDGGKLDTEVTGRAEDDRSLTSTNHWIAPEVAGAYHLWLVLRDSRGGSDFARYALTVAP